MSVSVAPHKIMGKQSFLYFAYGSNLLTDRIRINNPSALARGVARLSNYKLEFNSISKKWGGAVATINPDKNEDVWGVLWELDIIHMATLDKQEGVPKVYNRKNIEVEMVDGTKVQAITYFMVKPQVEDRRPSMSYHQVSDVRCHYLFLN